MRRRSIVASLVVALSGAMGLGGCARSVQITVLDAETGDPLPNVFASRLSVEDYHGREVLRSRGTPPGQQPDTQPTDDAGQTVLREKDHQDTFRLVKPGYRSVWIDIAGIEVTYGPTYADRFDTTCPIRDFDYVIELEPQGER